MYVVDRRIQERRPLLRNQHLKPGNMVQVESEHCQPVVQTIVCDAAESEHLMNAWDQGGVRDVVIQVVWNIEPGGTAEDFGGLLGYAVETQTSRRENLPYLFSPVHSEGHQPLGVYPRVRPRWKQLLQWPQLRPVTTFSAVGTKLVYG